MRKRLFLLLILVCSVSAAQQPQTRPDAEAAKKKLEEMRIGFVPASLLDAAENGQADVVGLLPDAGMPTDVRDQYHDVPLTIAAEWGNTEVVRVLLAHGAGVDERGNGGRTALISAAEGGYADTVLELIKAGADVDGKDRFLQTPLKLAIKMKQSGIETILRDAGAREDGSKEAEFVQAGEEGNVEKLRAMINAGFNPTLRDNDTNFALMATAAAGKKEAVAVVLAARTEVPTGLAFSRRSSL
jgi:ankyrin repeat protein